MNINITLLGEMLTFAVLIWVTMKYVWPPIVKVMQERQHRIAQGLAAAKRGQETLEWAQQHIAQQMQETQARIDLILEQAKQQANDVVAEGQAKAQEEATKVLAKSRIEIEQEVNRAKKKLEQETGEFIVAATEKLLQAHIDHKVQQRLIDKVIAEI